MSPKSIAVIGSLNVDFVTTTKRLPAPGETLTAESFDTGFGGKGANQAVACARLAPDTKVSMIGNVGDDHFGAEYLALLKNEHIDTSSIGIVEQTKTGIANIIVEADGTNRIMIAGNANHAFSLTKDASWDLVTDSVDITIFQLEIPLAVVLHNLKRSQVRRQHVILNPAPAVRLPDSSFRDINTLIVNETEALLLAGKALDAKLDLDDLSTHFFDLGVRDAFIVTLGSEGVYYASRADRGRLPAKKVHVVDTTAAGDTFLGAYAAALAEHSDGEFDIEAALRFATAASAVTVQRKGAMAAIPRRSEVSV